MGLKSVSGGGDTSSLSTGLTSLSTSTSTGIKSLSTSTSTGITGVTSLSTSTSTATNSLSTSASTGIAGAGGGGVPAYQAVGDRIFALYTIDAAIAPGDIINGSDLRVGTGIGLMDYFFPSAGATFLAPQFPVTLGAALAGTWRAMEYIQSATDSATFGTGAPASGGYFVRVT